MPFYIKKNILFIHIPKTGGTTLENFFKKDDIQKLYSGKTNNILPFPHNKISLQHQYLETILKFQNKLNIKITDKTRFVTIVRNPYERLVSDLFWYKLINQNSSQEEVFEKIKHFVKKENTFLYDNHNSPQYRFLCDNNGNIIKDILILNTENLTNDINKHFSKFNRSINNYNVNKINKRSYMSYLNIDSIKLINNIYEKDFELFNYKKV